MSADTLPAVQETGNTMTPQQIIDLRKSLGLKQREMAERLGCTLQSYQRFEYGTRTPSKTICLLLECIAREAVKRK